MEMVDALRKLLDSGKLSEEDCHSILRGLGNKVVGLQEKEKEKEVDGWRRRKWTRDTVAKYGSLW